MFTTEYLTAKKNLENLQSKFDKNPCKKTATPLSQARVDLKNVQMYTNEFRKNRETNFLMELQSLVVDFNAYSTNKI